MNKTIVTFIGKQVVAAPEEDRIRLIAQINPGKIGQVIETADTYMILRLEDGKILVLLDNRKGTEKLDAKITLTGLDPHCKFLVYDQENKETDYRLANQAGILECMYSVEATKTTILVSC